MAKAASIDLGSNWNEQGPSFGLDTLSFVFAIGLHIPLFFIQLNMPKKAIDTHKEKLVSVDLIEQIKPKEPEVAPTPVVAAPKGPSLMEKLKALVKKEPPPPAPPQIKPVEPPKLVDVPKPLALQPKLDMPEKIQPKLESKSGFQTQADPKLVNEQKLAMNAPIPGIAPMSAKKLGVVDDRNAVKNNKGNFQVKSDSLKSIGGDGPGLSGGGAPVIAIQTGSKATTEKFSAPVTQKTDKGRLGAVPTGNLNSGPQLGLRDSIIARDAAPTQINTGGRAGGAAGGIPGGTGMKKDAGRSFQAAVPQGVSGGAVGGLGNAGVGSAPAISAVPVKKKEKQSMFSITGPLKDRKILKQVPPEYPAWAQAQGISASVVLEFTVEPDGSVKNLVVVRRTSGYPKLDETAIEALRQWKFAPLADGENRSEVGLITFNYSLS